MQQSCSWSLLCYAYASQCWNKEMNEAGTPFSRIRIFSMFTIKFLEVIPIEPAPLPILMMWLLWQGAIYQNEMSTSRCTWFKQILSEYSSQNSWKRQTPEHERDPAAGSLLTSIHFALSADDLERLRQTRHTRNDEDIRSSAYSTVAPFTNSIDSLSMTSVTPSVVILLHHKLVSVVLCKCPEEVTPFREWTTDA